MRRWIIWAPLGVLALLAVLFAGFALRRDPTYIPAELVGKPLPEVALPRLDGGGPPVPLKPEAPAGTLVNFFASWCAPCIQEAPALMALKQQGVRIVGVAYHDEPAASRTFLNRYGDPFASKLVDYDGRAGIEFGVSGVPETFLIGPNGVIIGKHSGALTPAAAEALLAKAGTPAP